MMSHVEISEIEECGKEECLPHMMNEAPLTNGHSHLVNGALKLEGLSSDTDEPSVDKKLSETSVRSTANKPQSPSAQFYSNPDPYEFPHSPPMQGDKQSSSHEEPTSKPAPSPPTYQETIKASENDLLKHLPPSHQLDTNHSLATSSLSDSPIRLNGCHHSTFSSDPASLNATNMTTKPAPPAENSPSSSSKASAQLLAQTGGLISEYYSHSRLHQISTWRNSFSEYVNELHNKRKAAGVTSFPGKERLRRVVAQQSAESRGTNGRVALLPYWLKSGCC